MPKYLLESGKYLQIGIVNNPDKKMSVGGAANALIAGYSQRGMTATEMYDLQPLKFPKSGVTWTITFNSSASTYTISDGRTSATVSQYSAIYCYPDERNLEYAKWCSIMNGILYETANSPDLTSMLSRVAVDIVKTEEVERKTKYGFTFEDGYTFYVGTHSVPVVRVGEFPLSERQSREGSPIQSFYEASYERGTIIGELIRHFYENGYDRDHALLTPSKLRRFYYTVSGEDISINTQTRSSVTANWGTVVEFAHTTLPSLYKTESNINNWWFSVIPQDTTLYTNYNQFNAIEGRQWLTFISHKGKTAPYVERSLYLSEDGYIETYWSRNAVIGGLAQLEKKVEEPGGGGDANIPGSGERGDDDGTGDFDGEVIPLPEIPSLSAVDSGFCTIYAPTKTEINNLAKYLWSSSFDLNALRKMFANPMDLIISLSIMPFTPIRESAREIKVGGISTNVMMSPVAYGYYTFEFGTIFVERRYGSFLDYSPNAKCEIFLPFIGTRSININDIMNKNITLTYRIDILTGGCTAFLTYPHPKTGEQSIIYEFTGCCGVQIPVSATDFKGTMNSIMNIVSVAGSVVAGTVAGGVAGGVAMGVANSGKLLNSITDIQPDIITHGSSASGVPGFMGSKTPYLLFTYPNQCKPAMFKQNEGETSNITDTFSNFLGFIKCSDIEMETLKQIEIEEQNEIVKLLKEGVYV